MLNKNYHLKAICCKCKRNIFMYGNKNKKNRKVKTNMEW